MKQRKKMLVQVGVLVAVLFTVAAVINGYSIYRSSRNYIEMLEEHTGDVMRQTRASMEAYASLPWLLDYWKDHSEEMELGATIPRARRRCTGRWRWRTCPARACRRRRFPVYGRRDGGNERG